MPVKVNDFRTLKLYQKSIDFTCELLAWIDSNQEKFNRKELVSLRRKVMTISTEIARANVDIQIKGKFKKLNLAKDTMQSLVRELKPLMLEAVAKAIEKTSIELLKLLNGYFGMLSKTR